MPVPRTLKEERAVREVRGALEARRDGGRVPAGMCPGAAVASASAGQAEEATLCRFALANGGKAYKAAAHLQQVRAWRASGGLANGLDADNALRAHLPGNKAEVIRKYLNHGTIGYDREGRPVYLEHAAALANGFRQLEREGVTAAEMLAYRVQVMEYIYQRCFPLASERASRPVDQLRVIVDLSGLRVKGLKSVSTMRHYRAVVQTYTRFYPENLHSLHIVNAPQFFHTAVWPFLRVRLKARLLRKVKLVRRHEHTRLHKYISEGNLPKYLGGQLNCGAGGVLCACWEDMDRVINEQLKPEYLKETPQKSGGRGRAQWRPKPWQEQKLLPLHAPVRRVPVRPLDPAESYSEEEARGTLMSAESTGSLRSDPLHDLLKHVDSGSLSTESFGDLQNTLSGPPGVRPAGSLGRRRTRHMSVLPSGSSDERESPENSVSPWGPLALTPEKIHACFEDLNKAQAVIVRQRMVIRVVSLLSGLLLAAASVALLCGGGLLGQTLRASPPKQVASPAELFLPRWLVNMKVPSI